MNCPGCDRENAQRRRYCGRCGYNFDPICRSCSFVNDAEDRFCGGCGYGLVVASTHPSATSASGMAPLPRPTTHVGSKQPPLVAVRAAVPPIAPAIVAPASPSRPAAAPSAELDGLFVAPALPVDSARLPDSGVSQDDLDRLFGAVQ